MKRALVIIGTGLLLGGFQNCQPAKISASETAQSKTELLAVTANDPEDVAGQVAQTGSDTPTPPSTTPVVPETPVIPVRPGNGNGNGAGANKPPATDNGGGNVCILAGPGKSVKLGQSAAAVPGGQNPIPGVLCMSAKACLEIASQAFDVKGPEFRGYCKLPHGNPHVTHVTDAELQIKINAFLKK